MLLSSFTLSRLTYLVPLFFFFNDPAPPEIYTLSLHDALPIYFDYASHVSGPDAAFSTLARTDQAIDALLDRKSTRLNSSHLGISYAVFCLKKKNTTTQSLTTSTASQTNYSISRSTILYLPLTR